MSIFDRVGGSAAVTAAVDDVYRRMMADAQLAPHFDGIDMKRLKGHVRTLLAAAVGDREPYPYTVALPPHAPFDIGRKHFELVLVHLADTLADLGVDHVTLDAMVSALRVRSGGCSGARSAAESPSDVSRRVAAHRL